MASQPDATPPLTHVLETILYVKDMETSREFYKNVFGLEPMGASPRGTSFGIGNTVFLLFQLGLTTEDSPVENRGTIPGHGPSSELLKLLMPSTGAAETHMLKQHFCFAVDSVDEVKAWEARLGEKGVEIAGIMNWELGGRSVYFVDPDGHVGEVGSRGLWPSY